MVERLRLIAVHVEEPRRGQYVWVLTEKGEEERWAELDRQPEPARSYKQAMADGLMALQALVEDLDAGPRSDAAGENASADDGNGRSDQRSKRSSVGIGAFGFGPVR